MLDDSDRLSSAELLTLVCVIILWSQVFRLLELNSHKIYA